MDIPALLQPVPGNARGGPDPRSAGGALGRGFELLRSDRRHLIEVARRPVGALDPIAEAGGREPTWKSVATAAEVLLGSCKDLEVAACLVEAWSRLFQWEGLLDGLQLMRGLIEQYWDDLHPGIEQAGDVRTIRSSARAKWINWLAVNQDFQEALGTIQIDKGEGSEPLTVRRYLQSRILGKTYSQDPAEYQRLIQNGLMSPEAWRNAINRMGAPQRDHQVKMVQSCLQAVASIEAAATPKLPPDTAIHLSPLQDLLEGLASELRSTGNAVQPVTAAGGAVAAPSPSLSRGDDVGPLQSRQDTIRVLTEVARFLRSTEPHSPVSYMLDRCVRWLNLGFEDLMSDLIKDNETVGDLREVLGIKKGEPKDKPGNP